MRHAGIKSQEHEDQLYARMRHLSRKLHVPFPEALFKVWLIRNGKRELLTSGHSRSFTRGMYIKQMAAIDGHWANTGFSDGNASHKDQAGALSSSRYCNYSQYNCQNNTNMGYSGAAGNDNHGIIIGTGTTAESFEDFTLDSLISHGTGGGEMEYSGVVCANSWNAGSSYFEFDYERVFSNNSGGSITPAESAHIFYHTANPWNSGIFIRDKWSSGIAVADGESIAVEYEYRTSFP